MTRREVIDSFDGHWDENSKCQPEYFNNDDLDFIKRSVSELVGDSSNYKIDNLKLTNSTGSSLSFELSKSQ